MDRFGPDNFNSIIFSLIFRHYYIIYRVKDSQHALQVFRDFNFLGEDKLIFTIDITSLYIVIPTGEGLLALKHFFDLRTKLKLGNTAPSGWTSANTKLFFIR